MTEVSKASVRRFPRLLTGSEAAAFEKLLWKRPDFYVRVTAKPPATEFRFRIVLPRETCFRYPMVKSLFYGLGVKDFESELTLAYWTTSSGKKVSQFIPNLLHLVFRNAVNRWLESSWKFGSGERAKEESNTFRLDAKTKRGQQPDPVLALWATLRLDALEKKVEAAKKAYAKHAVRGSKIWNHAEKIASRDVLRNALQRLVGDNRNIEALFVDKRLTSKRVALAVFELEFIKRYSGDSKLRKISSETHRKLGKDLRTRLSKLPKPLSTRSHP